MSAFVKNVFDDKKIKLSTKNLTTSDNHTTLLLIVKKQANVKMKYFHAFRC